MIRKLFFLGLFVPLMVGAQTTSISPYSGFGLGDVAPQGYDQSFSMGGTGIGFIDSIAINPLNPASYAFFMRSNPVFQAGLKGQNLTLTSELNSNDIFNFSMNNFTLGFPISKKGGLVLGINPATTVGYRVGVFEEYTNADDYTFPVLNIFEGSGGINKFYLGAGYRVYEKNDSLNGRLSTLSFGFNFNYYTGTKNAYTDIQFLDSSNSFVSTRFSEATIINDFTFQFGLQYQKYFRKVSPTDYIALSAGATLTLPNQINTRLETNIYTYDNAFQDSVFFDDNFSGYSQFPLVYGIGFEVDINAKFQITADYEFQQWSKYSQVINGVEIRNDVLQDAYRIGLGFQFCAVPLVQRKVNTPFYKMIAVRAGYRFTQRYLVFDSYQLSDQAFSFGLNLPFSKSQSLSSLNLGIEFGNGGTRENGLIQEDFINFMIGLTLLPHRFNRWFVKRKYN